MSVSIVVPVHGRAALTRRCLDTLLAARPDRCELIIVDDASTDATPELLDSYGDSIRVVTLPKNVGYAAACNRGAAVARHERLVFLNNDTEPGAGWLESLCAYSQAHPAAAIVGAKLLYPTGVVQHAGVVIGQDGYPHNLYAGLPAEHPAVNRSRRLQAVTGACMLVDRAIFERLDGFDTAYTNSLEDVDLCLRVGAEGAEVHYCHEAVLTHFESASRGREDRFESSVRRYRERWRERVIRDDLLIYAQDGMLEVEYRDAYPLRFSISPLLASLGGDRESEIEALLESYASQVSELMAEVVRLMALTGAQLTERLARSVDGRRPAPTLDHRAFLAHVNDVEDQLGVLQQHLQGAGGQGAGEHRPAFTASRSLGYRRLVERVRVAVDQAVPEGSTVLVVSRGDRELLKLGKAHAGHFPQDPHGRYLGHHPRDSQEAIATLEDLRSEGADFLVLPSTAYWWLDHYDGFARYLHERYPCVEHGVCSIYQLRRERRTGATEVAR